MKRIYIAGSLPEAHLLLYRLEHAGVRARVFNENAQGGVGELPFTHTYPEIWLDNENDVNRALGIVAEFERRAGGDEQVECGSCGETNPATFELCWRCAAELSD